MHNPPHTPQQEQHYARAKGWAQVPTTQLTRNTGGKFHETTRVMRLTNNRKTTRKDYFNKIVEHNTTQHNNGLLSKKQTNRRTSRSIRKSSKILVLRICHSWTAKTKQSKAHTEKTVKNTKNVSVYKVQSIRLPPPKRRCLFSSNVNVCGPTHLW